MGLAGWGFSLFGVIVLLLALFALYYVLTSKASGGTKALWVVLILLLPAVGAIAYFLVHGTGGPRAADTQIHEGRQVGMQGFEK